MIVLAWHVHYWDKLGWKDPHGDKRWSERQSRYGKRFNRGRYTPMMVFDGGSHTHKFGVARAKLAKLLKKKPRAEIDLAAKLTSQKITIESTVSVTGKKLPDDVLAFVVIAEDETTTTPKRGENRSKVLKESSVVRTLLDGKKPTGKTLRWEVTLDSEWKRENLRVVLFLQSVETMEVLEARQCRLE